MKASFSLIACGYCSQSKLAWINNIWFYYIRARTSCPDDRITAVAAAAGQDDLAAAAAAAYTFSLVPFLLCQMGQENIVHN